MANLQIVFICGVLWTSLCRVITVSTDEYKYVNESMAWLNAVDYCNIELNGSLADDNVLSLPAINESSSDFWIGRYSSYTHWTWITGCFSSSVVIDITFTAMRLNSVVTCHSNCNTTFVAMRGTSCFCLTDKPDDIYGSDSCNVPCNGNSKELCGGFSAVSVYEKVTSSSSIATIPADGNQPCGSITPTLSSVLYFQRKCVLGFRSACKIYKSGANLFEIVPFDGSLSWDEANSNCKYRNGSLADIQSSAQFTKYLRGYLTGDTWIGLYRLQNTFTIQEKSPDISSMITCSYYNQGEIIEKSSLNCNNEERPFYCRIKRKSETSIGTAFPAGAGNQIAVILGIIFGIIVIAVVLLIIILLYRNKRKQNTLGTPELPGKTPKVDNTSQQNECTYSEADTVNVSDLYAKVKHDDVIYQEADDGEYDVLHERRERLRNHNHNEVYYDHTGNEIYNHVGETGDDENYKHKHKAQGQTENIYDHTGTVDKPNLETKKINNQDQNEHLYNETEI